jgi:broad-specificity NMP kinase
MKKLIIINGTMGVGKTTVCKELYRKLNNSVWLDGDWCWMMNPWVFNEENKNMVIQNTHFLLNNYLKNSGFEYIIFDWVIHTEDIMNTVIKGLKGSSFKLYKISLVCDEEQLKERMLKDRRSSLQASVDRLKTYHNMDTLKIDTTNKGISDIVNEIMKIINY